MLADEYIIKMSKLLDNPLCLWIEVSKNEFGGLTFTPVYLYENKLTEQE